MHATLREGRAVKYQFMPMFWGDFFANTLHLSAQEVGAYVLLIAHAWEHDGKIAVADLQRVARVSNRNWHRVRHRVTPLFDTLSDATSWTSQRVLAELSRAAELSNKRRVAAVQMHSKRSAHASVLHEKKTCKTPPSTLQLPIENLTNGKGSKGPSDFRDDGNDYRSPPRTKPDLPPLTEDERLAAMLLAAKDRR
jgi:uncharacterized protein YdaU (DUF1376 family)